MIRRTPRLAPAMLLTILLAAASEGAHAHAVLVESTPARRSGSRERPRPGYAAVQRTRPGHIAAIGRRGRSSNAPRTRPSKHAGSSGGAAPVAVARQLRRELAPSVCGWAPRRRLGLLHARDGAAPCRSGRDGAGGRDAGGAPHGAPRRPRPDLRRRAPGGGPRPLSRPVRAARGRGLPGHCTAGSRGCAARCRCDRNRHGRPISDVGGRARDALNPTTLARVLGTGFGLAALVRLAGLVALLVALAQRNFVPMLGAAGALAVAASFAFTGHTVRLNSPVLSALLVFHLLAVAFWTGSFIPLLRATRGSDVEATRELMLAFSAVAVVLVPGLVAAGAAIAWFLIGGLPALVTTPYGLALSAKITLVAGNACARGRPRSAGR